VNLVLLSIQMLAALRLLRLKESGVRLTNVFCVALYIYEPFGTFFGFGEGIGMSLGATAGTGNMGTAPQFLTGYPILAFIALNLAAGSRRDVASQPIERKLRPGVVVIAVWALFLGIVFAAGSLAMAPNEGARILGAQMFMLFLGGTLVLIGIGLLFKREWARFAMIPFAAYLTGFGSSTAGYSSNILPAIHSLLFLTFHSWMIWYLFRRWYPPAPAANVDPSSGNS